MKRRLKFMIPMMVVVGVLATLMLNKDHSEVPQTSRILITLGAVVFTGATSYFLFAKESEDEKQ